MAMRENLCRGDGLDPETLQVVRLSAGARAVPASSPSEVSAFLCVGPSYAARESTNRYGRTVGTGPRIELAMGPLWVQNLGELG